MLQVGSVVTYESATRGPVRAVIVKGPNADGTWDLDVKPQVHPSRIRCAQPQPPVAPVASTPSALGSISGPPATMKNQDVSCKPIEGHRPVGTVCFYKSTSRGWIPARVTRFCHQNGVYDLDCKPQALIECIFWIDEGVYVEYYSPSQNKWVPARVLKAGAQPGTFDLDIREAADVQRMRPRNGIAEQSNLATLQAMPGMMCYANNSSGQEDAKDLGAIQYETHRTDIRLRPRSKTPEPRRVSKEEIRMEQQVRNDLAKAIGQGNPEALQAAISRANSQGISSGPELAHAIQVLHSMGARLQRTPSADALHPINGLAPDARSLAMQHMKQGMEPAQVQNQQNADSHVNDREEPCPGPKPGFLTHVLGPKPSENAGLLTRVLGPKPTEEAGILERVFGLWGKEENSDDDDSANHDTCQALTHTPNPFVTGAVERNEGPPTEPHLQSQMMSKVAAASIESPYKPTGEQGGFQALSTDPQLQRSSAMANQQSQQQYGVGSFGGRSASPHAPAGRPSTHGSAPPTDPKLLPHNLGQTGNGHDSFPPLDSNRGSAPPTDPKLLPHRSGQSAYGYDPAPPLDSNRGSAPPTDPKLLPHRSGQPGYRYDFAPPLDSTSQHRGSAPPTDPKLQGYGSAPPTDPKLQGYGVMHQGGPPTNPQLQQISAGSHLGGSSPMYQAPPTAFGGGPPTNPQLGGPRIS